MAKEKRDVLYEISDLFTGEDLEKYEQIFIKIQSSSYFTVKGKRKDGLIDKWTNYGHPLCKETGKRK